MPQSLVKARAERARVARVAKAKVARAREARARVEASDVDATALAGSSSQNRIEFLKNMQVVRRNRPTPY